MADVQSTIGVEEAADALEDQVRLFANQFRGPGRERTMSPDEWERAFRAWQERNSLREVIADMASILAGLDARK